MLPGRLGGPAGRAYFVLFRHAWQAPFQEGRRLGSDSFGIRDDLCLTVSAALCGYGKEKEAHKDEEKISQAQDQRRSPTGTSNRHAIYKLRFPFHCRSSY
jgi:hypothetical protein